MKQGMLVLLLLAAVFAQGQSLKDALYSGKLKNQPGSVIRKGDDLSTKMVDSAYLAYVADSLARLKGPDSALAVAGTRSDSATLRPATATTTNGLTATDTGTVTATADAPPPVPKPADNNAVWKDYMTTIAANLKEEALSSKKIKKGDYYVSVPYTIETDGQVTVGEVTVSPENDQLKKQIKERVSLNPPSLTPVLNSSGTPRKVTRRYNFTLTKD